MSVSDDLHAQLECELEHLEVEQQSLDRRRAAVLLLLERVDPFPPGTFKAPVDAPTKRKGGMKAMIPAKDREAIRKSNESHGELARRFKTSRGTIFNVINRRGAYAHD